jgi:uncharacterized membrane protein YqjE
MSDSPAKPSPAGPLQRLFASFLGLLQTHLGLFSIELEEARDNLLKTLVLAIVGAGAILLGLMTLMLTIVLMVDPEQRVFVAIGVLAFFLLLGGICLGMARHIVSHALPPFSQTLDELRRDRERLLP